MHGLLLAHDFITPEEEDSLMKKIDGVEWILSQSGRRKQDYGPRVNFKHKKVKYDRFVGMPDYADLVLERMRALSPEKLGEYQPFELCNLEYDPNRQSAIEFHQDDMWIWGNRLISVNLLSGSVMTLIEEQQRKMVFVPMPRYSLLCMADDARYRWKHGIIAKHINVRRVALTMREPAPAFQCGGDLYEKFGKDLIRLGNIRLPLPS
uniref:Alpha-ketoglutarate-dependent dioxygenase AlkB-like domain-containing protein n=2 Tax=Plectus sambesii TaxID=2011161 RepID=A0A914UYT9_9BILA